MNNFFVAHLLALILIAAALVRPFFKKLNSAEGISLFPLFALILEILIIAGGGLSLENFVPFVWCFIAFICSFKQLTRFIARLPTDWFSAPARVAHIIGLALTAACLCFVYVFSPEDPKTFYYANPVRKEVFRFYEPARGEFSLKPAGFAKAAGTCAVWFPAAQSEQSADAIKTQKKLPAVIYAPEAGLKKEARETAAYALASNGYIVLSADFYERRGSASAGIFSSFAAQIRAVFFANEAGSEELTAINRRGADYMRRRFERSARLLRYLSAEEEIFTADEEELYAVFEGAYFSPADLPESYETAAVVLLTRTPPSEERQEYSYGLLTIDADEFLPPESIQYHALRITASGNLPTSYGEAGVNSPFFAFLMGGERDKNGSAAMRIGQKIRAFFDARKDRIRFVGGEISG